jgi:hypothetical protein
MLNRLKESQEEVREILFSCGAAVLVLLFAGTCSSFPVVAVAVGAGAALLGMWVAIRRFDIMGVPRMLIAHLTLAAVILIELKLFGFHMRPAACSVIGPGIVFAMLAAIVIGGGSSNDPA